ncbi:DNA gyrase subunit A [Andreesenia angusta]|uniref:DNA gyrase subunit A n=1 Tax=Andreesenia angusta TaxID=39480 RepID=A0A1S1V4B6_9FIRM|nr:DNA gyrase subunit A [Andreesenia angusta]OHW61294.1 DNA gyrase subunit A [Andreesenia angusta]
MSEEMNNLKKIDIEQEMKKSYLDYAMSVIVSRALPDVRDGLKPVHRRIIYAMNELSLQPEKPHRKSARIVGDVLGKYHPHGDTAVYDAMVRLAQEFSTRYLLVDGHGNFGSVDGDSAAAMRYTEARMGKITTEMLRDIEKETIDYRPNFDETLDEPKVLPSRFPNLLANGSSGIAVGMATSIPPHNLKEIINGIVELIENPEVEVEDILKHIKGPDFPTGAMIMGKDGLSEAYRTGRGKVTVRAVSNIEVNEKGRSSIIFTEIPYQVNKAREIEKIASLVRDKKIEGISDLRDESDRDGMRIVVEVKKDANPNVILNKLYKYTQLQNTFSIIMIALVDDRPKLLNLKEIMQHYLSHQHNVIVRRTKYELKKAESRAHILEGLKIALDRIDEVIKLIRGSKIAQEAKDGLIEKFGLSEIQAQAILDMRLQRLTGLERGKIEDEYKNIILEIAKFKEILSSDELIYKIIKDELLEIKEKYGDKRRTRIVPAEDELDMEDLIDEEDVVINLTHMGYIKRMPEDTYKTQRRGGRGISGITTRDEDFVSDLFTTSTHDNLLFFTNQGRAYCLKAYDIPEAKRQAKGTAIINLLQLNPGEKVNAVIPIRDFSKESYLVMVTDHGVIKKIDLEQLKSIRKTGIIAITLKDGDELISVRKTSGEDQLIAVTSYGLAIMFEETDVRAMGRTAAGVKAMTLKEGDKIVGVDLVEESKDLLVISENGYGKRTPLEDYRLQKRGGKGIKTYNVKDVTGNLISAKVVSHEDEVMINSTMGTIIRLNVGDISNMGRTTQGVRLMKMQKDDKVSSVAKIVAEE